MIADKALANFSISLEIRRGGDTGRRRVEHRNFLQLRFTHQNVRFRPQPLRSRYNFYIGDSDG